MNSATFKSLKPGDRVTLAERRPAYGHFSAAWSGRAYVPAGTVGTVGAVKVPAVTGRERFFACVDFPPDTPLEGHDGKPLEDANPHRNPYRVAAYREELV